jgi:hypothetical protein
VRECPSRKWRRVRHSREFYAASSPESTHCSVNNIASESAVADPKSLFLPFLPAPKHQIGTYSNYSMGCLWKPLYTPARHRLSSESDA